LNKKNQELVIAVAKYRNISEDAYKNNQVSLVKVLDSVYIQQYEFIPATVINNSVNKQNNYLTLDVGTKHGIDKGMAVISPMGIIGIVKESSEHYSSVISLLNQNLRVSGMIKRNGYFGSINWDGVDYQRVILFDLPSHVEVRKGDTVITSGYSAMFPKGELVGLVDGVEKSERGDFLKVQVKLSVNFKNLAHVMVVKNLLKEEQLMLEREASHD
jgi:rod shape-determining protein MreC